MDPVHSDDVALARAALRSEPGARDTLFARLDRLPGLVRARAKRLGKVLRPDEVDETVQTVLVTMWNKLDTYDGRAPLEAWVAGIAAFGVLKALDRRRAQAEIFEYDEGTEPAARNPQQAGPGEAVHAALEHIGPPGDEITRLKHFEDLTFAEIAARLQMPSKTVMSRYYRTLSRLRTLLGSQLKGDLA